MNNKKIKVVWICHFSNSEIRDKLNYGLYLKDILRKVTGKSPVKNFDYAQWNTNGVREFEKFKDIELTIVMPMPGLQGKMQHFILNGIDYFCYRSEDDILFSIFHKGEKCHQYTKNRELIKEIIDIIHPDLVHVIGAENPYYSLAALDVPSSIPVLVHLQTLLSDPAFYENYCLNQSNYIYRSDVEKKVIRRADYVTTGIVHYREIILKEIKPNCKFINLSLAVGQPLDLSVCEKEFDFVYFASDIQKTVDYAIEAFGIACKTNRNLTLNIVGAFDNRLKKKLDNHTKELGIYNNVFYSGRLPTHGDVMAQIKKSRYALLPLKIDFISGTVREAMSCGLPVVTTITQGTPLLNKDRKSILLSKIGDFEGMAANMIKLSSSEKLYNELRANSAKTFQELYSNKKTMQEWRDAYKEVIAEWNN